MRYPRTALFGIPSYINFLDTLNSYALVKELWEANAIDLFVGGEALDGGE